MIDKTALESIVSLGDESLLRELIDLFGVQTPIHLENIRVNIEEQKPTEISRSAHTLKSSCRYLGAFDMADICVELEEWARQSPRDFEKARGLLSELIDGYENSSQQLRDYRKNYVHQENSALF